MRIIALLFALTLTCFAQDEATQAKIQYPGRLVAEAEEFELKDTKLVKDPLASGGEAVSSDKAGTVLLIAKVPPKHKQYTVWVRWKGGEVLLKNKVKSRFEELKWIKREVRLWTWSSFGRFEREELGPEIVIARGEKGCIVDCVVFATSEVTTPPVLVSVNWKVPLAQTSKRSFGLNTPNALDPAIASQKKYQEAISYMAPGIVRYHSWNMIRPSEIRQRRRRVQKNNLSWLDFQYRTWDAKKIQQALEHAPVPGNRIMINIPSWPDWYQQDRQRCLSKADYVRFAQHCANLVRIVNIQQKRGVRYWEVTDEMDGRYGYEFVKRRQPDRINELAELWLACAKAMKVVDPTIKVGGPAAAYPGSLDLVRKFVGATKDQLDFFSFHMYASGTSRDSDATIFSEPAKFGKECRAVIKALGELSPKRNIEAHLNEYNISWTSRGRDPRMLNGKGAVFDAMVMMHAAEAGVDVTNAWAAHGPTYGKIDPAFKQRPSAHIQHLFNSHSVGTVMKTKSSNAGALKSFAVKGDTGRSVTIANYSNKAQNITLEHEGWKPGETCFFYVASVEGLAKEQTLWADLGSGKLTVEPFTVIQIVFKEGTTDG